MRYWLFFSIKQFCLSKVLIVDNTAKEFKQSIQNVVSWEKMLTVTYKLDEIFKYMHISHGNHEDVQGSLKEHHESQIWLCKINIPM